MQPKTLNNRIVILGAEINHTDRKALKGITMDHNVQEFLQAEKLAVVGVSRSEQKFGSTIYKELKERGFEVYGSTRLWSRSSEIRVIRLLQSWLTGLMVW